MNLILRRHRPLQQLLLQEETPDPACYLDAEKESSSSSTIHSQTPELLDTDAVSSHRYRRSSFLNLRSSHPTTSLPQEGPRRASSFAAITHILPPSSPLNAKSTQSVDFVQSGQNDDSTVMCSTKVARSRSSIQKIAFLLNKRRSSFFKEKDGVVVNSTANYQIQRTGAMGSNGMRGSSLRAMSMRKFNNCSGSDGSSNGDSDDTLTTKDEEGAEMEAADDLLLVSEKDTKNGAAAVTTDPGSGDKEDDGSESALPLSLSFSGGDRTTTVTSGCSNYSGGSSSSSSSSSVRLDRESCAGSLLMVDADNRVRPSDDTIEELEPTTTTTTVTTATTDGNSNFCGQPRVVGSMEDVMAVDDSLRHRNNNSQKQQQRTPRRRPLKLGRRWKAGKTGDRRHSMIEYGINNLPSSLSPTAAAQTTLKGLDIVHSNRQSLCINMSLARNSKDITSPQQQYSLLSSRGGNNGSAIFKKGRWLGPPKPNASVQARIDAFNSDDNEFCIDDYDLSGSLFELPSKRTKVGAQKQQLDVVLATEQKLSDSSRCTTPRSRLSSTSTVVEGCTMGPEHYKRIFVSSARKLQWQSERRGIGCIVHIRNTMSRAGERYVEVSGGRILDATQISRAAVADYYYSNSSNCAKKDEPAQCESPLLNRRSRTFSSSNLANLAEEVDGDVNVDATYPAAAAADLPLTSPPGGRTASTELADAAMASIASAAAKENSSVIEGFGSGDLVSLETNELDGPKQTTAATTTTTPYRSRHGRKRQQLAATIDINCSSVVNRTS